jgi:hypothetical protein
MPPGAEQVELLLPHTGCLTLVTSRQRFSLPKLQRLDLDALTPQAARELLLSLAPRLLPQKHMQTGPRLVDPWHGLRCTS